MFLESRQEELVDRLSLKMQSAVKDREFEEAAKIRDQISALRILRQDKISFAHLDEAQDLKNLLGLSKAPDRIEAFDISNISGKEAAGSMVSFYRGLPDKNNYRRFRIKTVVTVDDYKMLAEVVRRRYLRIIEENLAFPDLVLIDGGKSHLLTADKEIKKLGISLALASIAKEKENIYVLGKARPVRLDEGAPALNLIRRIRDEAHRFARAYHHLLRRKKIIGK
jgi:excinuclease ABC subunit C